MVNNAVDAILERSTDGDLWVRTGTNGDRLFIEFTDSGPGVQDASRVFDPFYTTKPVGKGTGLGLSICYGIITEHGGTIRVRNVPTRGASFTIELPVQSVAATTATSASPSAVPGRDRHILLLDHDESILEAVGTILRGCDYKVEAATNFREAVTLLEKREFDLIIADLQISEGSDQEGFRDWLAQHKPALSRNVIWMCAAVPSLSAGEKIARNDCQILQKPFKASDVIAAVDELVLNMVHTAPVQR
jgi:two-component system NtrC family sensor kinase